MRARVLIMVAVLLAAAGCSTRKSALLLERPARGSLEGAPAIAHPLIRELTPSTQTQTKGDLDITVTPATTRYLTDLFSNKAIFGPYAGANPFFPEHLVFYVKIANRSHEKIRVNPADFVLIDDRGSQYSPIGVDYITAFAEYRQPVASGARGLLENASPGYFGFSFPVGKYIASKPQGHYALIQQSSLQAGYFYPGVVHDGLITFWNPDSRARTLRLLIANIKASFDPNDVPQSTLEFPFEFTITVR